MRWGEICFRASAWTIAIERAPILELTLDYRSDPQVVALAAEESLFLLIVTTKAGVDLATELADLVRRLFEVDGHLEVPFVVVGCFSCHSFCGP